MGLGGSLACNGSREQELTLEGIFLLDGEF